MVLNEVHSGRGRRTALLAIGRRGNIGKARHTKRLPHNSSAPRGLLSLRHAMARQGVCGQGVTIRLAFGPVIFSAVADALLWIMYERRVRVGMHYLDDFLFIGRPQFLDCAQQLQGALRVCEELGVPVARGKIGGRSTTLVFLGIELDTVAGVLRLPQEKLLRLRQEIRHWQARRAGTKRELLSLIGSLQHAASVVPAGRSFTRRLIDASKSRRQLAQYCRLNAEARADLQW